MRSSPFFKNISRNLKGIDIVLSSPWCTYDVVQVEKDLGKKTKITDAILKSMFVKKDEKQFHVVESYMSNMLLNGYKVAELVDQSAETVAFQYIHVYARESFITPLIRAMESVFNTHKVFLTSIYGITEFVSKLKPKQNLAEIQIILEDENIDVSYLYDGLHIVNMFIPYSYAQVEQSIAMSLSAHKNVIEEILISRGECMRQEKSIQVDKNAKKLWPDLDAEVKQIVDISVAESMEKVVQYVRDCVDKIDLEYIKNSVSVQVYCTSKNLVSSYGLELAHKVASDPYLTMKIHPTVDDEAVRSLF